MAATEDQLKQLDALRQQLDDRQAALTVAEQRMAAFEAQVGDLARLAADTDVKIQAMAGRESMVSAIKAEVDQVRDVAAARAFAEAIRLLKQDYIGAESAKGIGDLLEVPAELDIPADNLQLALVVSGGMTCWRASDAVNLCDRWPRIIQPGEKSEERAQDDEGDHSRVREPAR